METFYWIQRLGAINTVAWVVFIITLMVVIISTIICTVEAESSYNEDKWYNRRRKTLRYGGWTVAISLLLGIFVPTKNELYAIYGIGGTIDYIKSNDTAKQIPDKVINALDAWIDNQIGNNQDK